jgi:hypothetical protein
MKLSFLVTSKISGSNFDGENIKNKATRVMSEWASETERTISKYPPPPANSSYVRTGALGRGWSSTTKASGDAIESNVTNSVEYAKYVHGGKFAYIGWKTLDDIAGDQWKKTVSELAKAFKP